MKIEIITTPNDKLKETGFGSYKSCQSVVDSISKLGHDVKLNMCRTLKDLTLIVNRKPDLVVLAVKYITVKNGADIWLSDYFAEHDINFSGSSREILKYDSDKVRAKTHLRNMGIKTADFFTAIPGQYKQEADLPLAFPLFLKPLDAANGNGIDDSSLVTNFKDYKSKIISLFSTFNLPVLAEEYLDGKEFSVAIIETEHNELIVSAVEILPPESKNGLRILGEKAKKEDSEEIRKIEDQAVLKQITKLAADAYFGLGISDFGRIDIKTNKYGDCFFMEANLVPGMTAGSSYFPLACEIAHKLTYDTVIQLIVEKGTSRADYIKPLALPAVIVGKKSITATYTNG